MIKITEAAAAQIKIAANNPDADNMILLVCFALLVKAHAKGDAVIIIALRSNPQDHVIGVRIIGRYFDLRSRRFGNFDHA